MAKQTFIKFPVIKLDGTEMDPEILAALVDVTKLMLKSFQLSEIVAVVDEEVEDEG